MSRYNRLVWVGPMTEILMDHSSDTITLFKSLPVDDTRVYNFTLKGKKKVSKGLSLDDLTEGIDYNIDVVPYEFPEERKQVGFHFGRATSRVEVGREYETRFFDRFQYVGYDSKSMIFTYKTKREKFNVKLLTEGIFKVVSIE